MLTISLLAVAAAATCTCVHLWIENNRLAAELADLRRDYRLLQDQAWKVIYSNSKP